MASRHTPDDRGARRSKTCALTLVVLLVAAASVAVAGAGSRARLLEEREVGLGRPSSVKRAFNPRRAESEKQAHGTSRSLSSYHVDWRRRYLAEHAHVHRLLRKLRSVRTVQAHVEARPAHYEAWLCIHHYEAAWDANTGNGYWGGLQMDREFMADYGPDLVARYGGRIVDAGGGVRLAYGGEANHWTPLEQMQVAERGWQNRGFSPWPNTARMCGLR